MTCREGNTSHSFVRHAITLPLVHFILAVGVLSFHVHAEGSAVDSSDRGLWERVTLGPEYFTTIDKVLFAVLIVLAMELLNYIAHNSGGTFHFGIPLKLPKSVSYNILKEWMNAKQIPVRGKHLDDLSRTDRFFIGISKAQTGPFVYFFLRYCFAEPNILWKLDDVSLRTILLPLPIFFIVFDFFYTPLHWALHIKAIYGYVHKHHHTQKAPR
jgi:hypothetical protein